MRLYHNPRCSKSRQALALLQANGTKVEIYRYLEEGIAEEDLSLLANLQGIVRKGDAGREVMASLNSVEDVEALLKHQPRLLERPVLICDGHAVIGRPPEDVLRLVAKE